MSEENENLDPDVEATPNEEAAPEAKSPSMEQRQPETSDVEQIPLTAKITLGGKSIEMGFMVHPNQELKEDYNISMVAKKTLFVELKRNFLKN